MAVEIAYAGIFTYSLREIPLLQGSKSGRAKNIFKEPWRSGNVLRDR